MVAHSGCWDQTAALHYFRGSWVLMYQCVMLIEHFGILLDKTYSVPVLQLFLYIFCSGCVHNIEGLNH